MSEPMHSAFEPISIHWQMIHARLDRAEEHFASFDRSWTEYLGSRPHRLERTQEDHETISFRLRRHRPLPTDLSLSFGELLYELRAALDNCLYAVAVLVSGADPPPSASRLEWPIRLTAAEWKSQAARYRDLPNEIVGALEAIQPYQAEIPAWNALGILHDLARIDRHRSMHGLGIYLTEFRLRADATEVEVVNVHAGGIVDDGDVVVRVRPGADVELSSSNLDLDLEFTVDITTVEEAISPSGTLGRPWGALDNRLRTLIKATREYTSDLLAIAAAHAQAKNPTARELGEI